MSQHVIIMNNETTTQAKAQRLVTFRMVSWWRWRMEKDKKEKVLGSGGSFNFTWGGQGRPPGGGV